MNIVICDDDINFINRFNKDFKQYFTSLFDNITVNKVSNPLSLSIDKEIDILFIDIDLDGLSGINYAKHLSNIFPDMIVIFISSRDDLVFDTLSTSIFQFIRKAKYEEDIIKVFKQLYSHLQKRNKTIIVDEKGRKQVICIHKIQYIVAIGRELIIKTNTKDYVIVSSLKNILNNIDIINYKDLHQISRSEVINFNYVNYILKSEVIMKDNTKYKIGRKYKDDTENKYMEYLLR